MSSAARARQSELEFAEEFTGDELDLSRWIPAHLPQWSSRAEAAARYELRDGHLVLQISEDQQPWCREFDGATKVTSLQTGVYSGPVGSRTGQHRFSDSVVVREAQAPSRLYTPLYGFFELRAKAIADPRSMVAFWMIGFEDAPEHAGEICICEIFGSEVEAEQAIVGLGVHPFSDPNLVDDFDRATFRLDVTDFHTYAAEWTPDYVRFFIDGVAVKETAQSPAYPMQFMLGIYEFSPVAGGPAVDDRSDAYPKEFIVDYVHGYRPLQPML